MKMETSSYYLDVFHVTRKVIVFVLKPFHSAGLVKGYPRDSHAVTFSVVRSVTL